MLSFAKGDEWELCAVVSPVALGCAAGCAVLGAVCTALLHVHVSCISPRAALAAGACRGVMLRIPAPKAPAEMRGRTVTAWFHGLSHWVTVSKLELLGSSISVEPTLCWQCHGLCSGLADRNKGLPELLVHYLPSLILTITNVVVVSGQNKIKRGNTENAKASQHITLGSLESIHFFEQ